MIRKRPLSTLAILGNTNNSSEHSVKEQHAYEAMDSTSGEVEVAYSSSWSDPAATIVLAEEDLHRSLVSAIFDVGVQIASPTKIAEHMHLLLQFPHLKTENIKSHLQRFRKTYTVGKIKFMDEYDRFLERLRVVHNHNTVPGCFGMVDLRQVLGGKSAALMTYSVMEGGGSSTEGISQQGGDNSNIHKPMTRVTEIQSPSPSPSLPKGEILDYAFVHTMSLTSGINVTKLPIPRLTQEEMNTPVGKSFLQLYRLLKEMERYLLQRRGITSMTMAPPRQPMLQPSVVSLETLHRRQQKQEKQQMHTTEAKGPPTFSWYEHANRENHVYHHHHKGRPRRRNRDLGKLYRLVATMTNRRKGRAKLLRRNPQVTFSVPEDHHHDNVDDGSSSDSSSSTSSSNTFQGRIVPGRKASVDVSTLSIKSLSSPAHIFVDSPLSSVESEWIFEDIPKPENLRRGEFFNMDSSSSSLSTDNSDQEQEFDEVTVNNDAAPALTVERQATHQGRSSDVSAIGIDHETLFADDEGSFTPSSAENQYDGMDTPIAPPSPSHAAMTNYLEMNMLDDNSQVASLSLEPNWVDFSGFSTSTPHPTPQDDHLSRPQVFPQERYPQARCTTDYSSQPIVHYPTGASALNPKPLARPPSLAESEPKPHAMHLPQTQGSMFVSHLMQQQQQQFQHPSLPQLPPTQYPNSHVPFEMTQFMFEPPRLPLPISPGVSSNPIPTPYNTPNDLSLFFHPPTQQYHQQLPSSVNSVHTNVNMLSPHSLPVTFPGLGREQPTQHLPLQQRYFFRSSSDSELGRFYPVDAWQEDSVADSEKANHKFSRRTT
jgi:hypothetical protein